MLFCSLMITESVCAAMIWFHETFPLRSNFRNYAAFRNSFDVGFLFVRKEFAPNSESSHSHSFSLFHLLFSLCNMFVLFNFTVLIDFWWLLCRFSLQTATWLQANLIVFWLPAHFDSVFSVFKEQSAMSVFFDVTLIQMVCFWVKVTYECNSFVY